MPYSRTSGTILQFKLNGIPYTPMADANFTEKPAGVENEAIATSGSSIMKKIKVPRNLESVTLGTDAADRAILRSVAESSELATCSYQDAAGDWFRCPACNINIEGNETETNTTTISVQVVEPWTDSLA